MSSHVSSQHWLLESGVNQLQECRWIDSIASFFCHGNIIDKRNSVGWTIQHVYWHS